MMPSSSAPPQKPLVVSRHCRNHSRRAVGRCGHHAASGGILFVHRHRVDRYPVERSQRITRTLTCASFSRSRCASRGARRRTFSPPGRIPSVAMPRSIHARITSQICRIPVSLPHARGRQRAFVRQHHLPDRQPLARGHLQQLGRAVERIRQRRSCHQWSIARALRVRHNESAADREECICCAEPSRSRRMP